MSLIETPLTGTVDRPYKEERAALARELRTSSLIKKAEILGKIRALYVMDKCTWVWADFQDDGSAQASLELLEIEDAEVYRRTFIRAVEYLAFCLERYDQTDRKFFSEMRRRFPNLCRRLWKFLKGLEVSSEPALLPKIRLSTGFVVDRARGLFFNDQGLRAEAITLAHSGDILAYCLLIPYNQPRSASTRRSDILMLRSLVFYFVNWEQSASAQALGHPFLLECSAVLQQVPDRSVIGRTIEIMQTMDMLDSPIFTQVVLACCATTAGQRLALVGSRFFEAFYARYWEWCTTSQHEKEGEYSDRVAQDCILYLVDTVASALSKENPESWPTTAVPLISNTDTMYLLAKALVRVATQDPDPNIDPMPFTFSVIRGARTVQTLYKVWSASKTTVSFHPAHLRSIFEPIWINTLQILQDVPDTSSRKSAAIDVWRNLGTLMGINEDAVLKAVREANTRLQNGQAGCANHKCPLYGVETVDRMFVCVGCKSIFYCSAFCQEMDWDLHRATCVQSQ